jgi:glycosyltransferase involved in cell wall biosynthesis
MPRISIFCKTLLKGGAEKQALILTKLLVEKHIDTRLINWSGDSIDVENLRFIEDHSIKYFALKGGVINKFFQYLRYIKDEKISISFSYLTLPNFISGISKLFNRDIITIGGIRSEKLPLYKFLFERWIHNRLNDATVFNNYSASKKFVKRGFKPGKINVIHNAIEIPALINNKDNKGEIIITTVSRFVKQKDFRTALYSFKGILEKNKDFNISYYLIGYGPLEQDIRLLAESLGIEQKVKILINPPNIFEILKKCDIYLSTSLFEGLSNSIMEAMVAGLPVVATDVGDNQYLVRNDYNGYIVPCMDVDQIVEKLDYLIKSDGIRTKFGSNSYSMIENGFTQEKLLNNYLNLVTEIVGK